MEENKYAKKIVNSNFYSEIKVNKNSPKTLTQEEFESGEAGYIHVPWVFVEHTEESLKEHKNFMSEYHKQHKYCPVCGSTSHSTTLIGYALNMDKKDEYKDLNSCKCSDCEDVHSTHDRISGL